MDAASSNFFMGAGYQNFGEGNEVDYNAGQTVGSGGTAALVTVPAVAAGSAVALHGSGVLRRRRDLI